MAGSLKFSRFKSLCSSITPAMKLLSFSSGMNVTSRANHSLARPSFGFVNSSYHGNDVRTGGIIGIANSDRLVGSKCSKIQAMPLFRSTSLNFVLRSGIPFSSGDTMLSHRFFSSSGGGVDKHANTEVSAASGNGADAGNSDAIGSDWIENVKNAWQGAVDAVSFVGKKAKETSSDLDPYVQQLFDSHPYLKEVVVPVGYTLGGTLLAWVVMPRVLRTFHKYGMQSQAALLSSSISGEEVPYEKSFWGALEDPARYLITFMAFIQVCAMVAPTTIASQYVAPAWRGAVILSFVWFLHRWKTNLISRVLISKNLVGIDREKVLTLEKISSVGLFVVGIMALAEACGVAVQSILTVGGIGGVATAFAARDVLGNVLSGLSLQFSKPFSLGDTIKAGSIEGQVVEMGLTTTSLLSAERFPVIVPNSLFSSQVIVNKSRAPWRAIVAKIPLKLNALDMIPQISSEIKSCLKSDPKVFLGREAPYCFLSRIESSFAELTLGYNLKQMSKDELYLAEQEILLQAVEIIRKHGAVVGSNWSG